MRFWLLAAALSGLISADRAETAKTVNVAQDQARALYNDLLKWRDNDKTRALSDARQARAIIDRVPPGTGDSKLYLAIYQDSADLEWDRGNTPAVIDCIRNGQAIAEKTGADIQKRGFDLWGARLAEGHEQRADSNKIAQHVLDESLQANDIDHAVSALELLSRNASAVGDFVAGITYLHRALDLSGQDSDPYRRAQLLRNLSKFYRRSQDYKKALVEADEAIAIVQTLNNRSFLASLYLEKSLIHSYLGDRQNEKAYLLMAEKISKETGDADVLMTSEINLSDDFLNEKNYPMALQKVDIALALAQKEDDKIGIATALINRGTALNHMGQHDKGLADIEAGVQHFAATQKVNDLVDALSAAADEYAIAGNYQKALEYQKKFKDIDDRFYHNTHTKATQELEAQYTADQQHHKISLLMNERHHHDLIRNFTLAFAAGLGLLMVLLFNRQKILARNQDDLQIIKDRLEKLSFTDPLTGLHNRRYFFEFVQPRIEGKDQAALAKPAPVKSAQDLIFYIIDLDHFKQINDGYGHHAGDLVLKQTVERLSRVTRDSDELIRWGGEEFLFVARHTSKHDAAAVAERLRQAVEAEPFDLGDGSSLKRTCSIGYAFYPLFAGLPGRPHWEAVVALADQALYQAKAHGRNGWIGASATRQATVEAWESRPPGGLHDLVTQGLCELHSSFDKQPCVA